MLVSQKVMRTRITKMTITMKHIISILKEAVLGAIIMLLALLIISYSVFNLLKYIYTL